MKDNQEFKQFIKQRKAQNLRIAENLVKMERASKRPEIETVKELFLYYFDYFFGELCFWQGWVPVIKLGLLPHVILLLCIYSVVHSDRGTALFCLLLYGIVMLMIIMMRVLLQSMKHHISSK